MDTERINGVMKRLGRWFKCLLLAVLASMTASCSLLPKEDPVLAPPLVEPAQMQFTTAKVTRGDISRSIAAVGNFYPVHLTNVFSNQSGRISQIHVKLKDAVKKGDLLVELDTGDLQDQIKDHEFVLKKAEIELQRAKRNEEDPYSVELASLNYEQEAERHKRMMDRLEAVRIYAPMDGIVTYVTERKTGDAVNPYDSLLQIAGQDDLLLMHPTILSTGERGTASKQINEIQLGMKIDIKLDSGKLLTGRVAQTPSSAPMNMPQESQKFFKDTIIITVDDLPTTVKIGDLADFTITLEKKENALLIPRGALHSFLGRDYVQVKEGSNLKEVDVETGIITPTQAEIVKGLNEGDLVILK